MRVILLTFFISILPLSSHAVEIIHQMGSRASNVRVENRVIRENYRFSAPEFELVYQRNHDLQIDEIVVDGHALLAGALLDFYAEDHSIESSALKIGLEEIQDSNSRINITLEITYISSLIGTVKRPEVGKTESKKLKLILDNSDSSSDNYKFFLETVSGASEEVRRLVFEPGKPVAGKGASIGLRMGLGLKPPITGYKGIKVELFSGKVIEI